MSFYSMLDHTCDIYHIQKVNKSPGYGLPNSPAFSYPESPDVKGVICHFGTRDSNGVRVRQNESYAELSGSTKLSLPIDTDIRLNDKVVHCETGIEYTAEIPKRIRNHHIIVMLRRTSQQAPIGEVQRNTAKVEECGYGDS
jgi:hypothetical protein